MLLRLIINANIRVSEAFDRLLPFPFRVDGNRDFLSDFAPQWIRQGAEIVDIGGGKNPYLSAERKKALGARVVGIDVSDSELRGAPIGAYDEVVCADIARHVGTASADVCICQAVLEHVPDTEAAFRGISSTLKPGGIALVFVPSRNAVFARLNLVLPQRLKERLLFGVFPHTRRNQGFPSYYDRCTPREFEQLAASVGLSVVAARYYYVSSYFSFFAPLYIIWRLWILLFKLVAGKQAAETFSYAFRKTESASIATAPPIPPARSAA